MLYNIHYWWFFLSQSNRWTKYLVHPKIWRPKPHQLMFASGHFGRLPPAAIHSVDCWFDSRVKWWIHVSSIVIYLHKTFFLLNWNSCKQHSESLMRCWFWSTVSKHTTNFEHSFLIDKCSCKMVNTLPHDIFNSFVISHNFNLQSAKMSFWRFLVFSGTTAEIGQPECSASFVSVRPCLKLAYHLLTIVSDGAESK